MPAALLLQATEMMAHLLFLAEDSSSAVGAAALEELTQGVEELKAKHIVLMVCAAKGSTHRGRPNGCAHGTRRPAVRACFAACLLGLTSPTQGLPRIRIGMKF